MDKEIKNKTEGFCGHYRVLKTITYFTLGPEPEQEKTIIDQDIQLIYSGDSHEKASQYLKIAQKGIETEYEGHIVRFYNKTQDQNEEVFAQIEIELDEVQYNVINYKIYNIADPRLKWYAPHANEKK